LSGVTVAINGHPEFGQTLSRADGQYDLAVNGGGLLTVEYRKDSHLPVQRKVQTPWQDYLVTDDVVMLTPDQQVTAIDLNSTAMQTAQGSVMTDADGPRQATVLFPAGTQATMTLPDGTRQPLTTLHVRATEYTVGENGPKAMPGPLPPTSGYTYAVELSADEALAVGAKTVSFDRPVPVYVDNFLNFPVGETVPVGWYDSSKAAWIPADNGKVIKIIAIADGLADLDTDGDGLADDAAKLAILGISAAEQQQLSGLYPAGKSLWRVTVDHFTPWDFNWPYGPPKDSVPPPEPDLTQHSPPKQDCNSCPGSSINPQARTVEETLPVTGTPYTLHYQSQSAKGYQTDKAIDIPLSGPGVPASLKSIELSVNVAGRHFTRSFPAAPNQNYHFIWDGLDGYGRQVGGSAMATVTVSYRYNVVYFASAVDFYRSFARASSFPGVKVIGTRGVSVIDLARTWQKLLSGDKTEVQGLGSWSLNALHSYDAAHRVLELGTGERRDAGDVGLAIANVAGGQPRYDSDGVPATLASLHNPYGIAFSPDGSLYIADTDRHRIRKVGVDGIITTVAGTSWGYGGGRRSSYTSTPCLSPRCLSRPGRQPLYRGFRQLPHPQGR
jgi:hypothetical protein